MVDERKQLNGWVIVGYAAAVRCEAKGWHTSHSLVEIKLLQPRFSGQVL